MISLVESLARQFSDAWIFAVVKPGFENKCKDIIELFEKKGWKLSRTRTKQLTLREAHQLYLVHKKEKFYEDLCEYMASDISVGLIFEKPGKISKAIFDEVGKIKDIVREKWGRDDMRNVLHSSDSLSAMERESELYF